MNPTDDNTQTSIFLIPLLLCKTNSQFLRFSISPYFNEGRSALKDIEGSEGVVSMIIDLAYREHIIKILKKGAPIHIEDSIICIFIELEKHTFLLVFFY